MCLHSTLSRREVVYWLLSSSDMSSHVPLRAYPMSYTLSSVECFVSIGATRMSDRDDPSFPKEREVRP